MHMVSLDIDVLGPTDRDRYVNPADHEVLRNALHLAGQAVWAALIHEHHESEATPPTESIGCRYFIGVLRELAAMGAVLDAHSCVTVGLEELYDFVYRQGEHDYIAVLNAQSDLFGPENGDGPPTDQERGDRQPQQPR